MVYKLFCELNIYKGFFNAFQHSLYYLRYKLISIMLVKIISKEYGFAPEKVKNTIALLDDGATVPFIARYRKEATGSMDEVAIGNIKDMYDFKMVYC